MYIADTRCSSFWDSSRLIIIVYINTCATFRVLLPSERRAVLRHLIVAQGGAPRREVP